MPIETMSEFFNQDSFDLVSQLDVHSILIEIFCIMVTCGKKMFAKYTYYLWATSEYREGKIGGDVKHSGHIVTFMRDADLLWKKLFDDLVMWFSRCVNVYIKYTLFNKASNTYKQTYRGMQVPNFILFFW